MPADFYAVVDTNVLVSALFTRNPGRTNSDESFLDPKDVVFYEVALSKEGSYLITGNTKHFPRKPIVVSPAEFMEIFKSRKEAWSTSH